MKRRVTPLLLMPLAWLAVGCAAGQTFTAFDGPPDPKRDVRLTIDDERVRVVSADGVAVPKDFGEASGGRTLWVRGDRAASVKLTLGIAPHAAVMHDEMSAPRFAPPPPGGGVSVSIGNDGRQGYHSTVRYPGSDRNQRITFAAKPAGRYDVKLDGKLDADKKPVWGFVVTDVAAKSAVPLGPAAWEPNAGGGVEATPWNLWTLPDDAIEMRSTTYR